MNNVTVSAYYDDSRGQASDAHYWGTPAFQCNPGEYVRIRLDTDNHGGNQMIHNGIAYFDVAGNQLWTQNGEWQIHSPSKDGHSKFLCPSFSAHAVVGKFGVNGEPFLVGDEFEAEATGQNLYLAVNDTKGAYHNNKGHFYFIIDNERSQYHGTRLIDPTKGWQQSFSGGYHWELRAWGEVIVGTGMVRDPDGNKLISFDHATGEWNKQPPIPKAGPSFLVPNLPPHTLIGKIGRGEPFLVGSYKEFTINKNDGNLQFALNETTGAYHNNKGHFHISWIATKI